MVVGWVSTIVEFRGDNKIIRKFIPDRELLSKYLLSLRKLQLHRCVQWVVINPLDLIFSRIYILQPALKSEEAEGVVQRPEGKNSEFKSWRIKDEVL